MSENPSDLFLSKVYGNIKKQLKVTPATAKEKNRGILSYIFVICFFLTIFAALLIGYRNSWKTESYKDLLLVLSSILSGPLGFIIGFYFKEEIQGKTDKT